MSNKKQPPFFNDNSMRAFHYKLPFYDTIELFIETLTGTCFELRVLPFEAVISVKAKIQRLEGTESNFEFVDYIKTFPPFQLLFKTLRSQVFCQFHICFCREETVWFFKYKYIHFYLFFLLLFCYKVSLLPSNTLFGTIWSWMMSIVCMTTGKSVAPYSFCPESTESEHLKKIS